MPTRCAKIFWDGGAHGRRADPFGHRAAPPLSKLHPAGKSVLEQAGWRRTGQNTTLIPAFSWTVRQGGDWGFGPHAGTAPVRQLPQSVTDLLDDKRELQLTLEQGAAAYLAPETHLDLAVAVLDGDPRGDGDMQCRGGSLEAEQEDTVWFLKHRRGVKGQAVTPVFSTAAVRDLVSKMSVQRLGDFVLQRGVATPHILHSYKYCMRVHVLEVAGASAAPYPEGAQCWMHEKVILLPHARPHVHGDRRKDAWVQQIGKNHPKVWRVKLVAPSTWPRSWDQLLFRIRLTFWGAFQSANLTSRRAWRPL